MEEELIEFEELEQITTPIFGECTLLRDPQSLAFYVSKEKLFNSEEQADSVKILLEARISSPNLYYVNPAGYELLPSNKYCPGLVTISVICPLVEEDLHIEIQEAAREKTPFEEQTMTTLLYDSLIGMAHLEELSIEHSSLSPSCIARTVSGYAIVDDPLLDPNRAFKTEDLNSTYFSPESYQVFQSGEGMVGVGYSNYKSDVFSLGLIILEAGTLKNVRSIFNKKRKMDSKLLDKLIKIFLERYPEGTILGESLKAMLVMKAKKRPSFFQILDQLPKYEALKGKGDYCSGTKNTESQDEISQMKYQNSVEEHLAGQQKAKRRLRASKSVEVIMEDSKESRISQEPKKMEDTDLKKSILLDKQGQIMLKDKPENINRAQEEEEYGMVTPKNEKIHQKIVEDQIKSKISLKNKKEVKFDKILESPRLKKVIKKKLQTPKILKQKVNVKKGEEEEKNLNEVTLDDQLSCQSIQQEIMSLHQFNSEAKNMDRLNSDSKDEIPVLKKASSPLTFDSVEQPVLKKSRKGLKFDNILDYKPFSIRSFKKIHSSQKQLGQSTLVSLDIKDENQQKQNKWITTNNIKEEEVIEVENTQVQVKKVSKVEKKSSKVEKGIQTKNIVREKLVYVQAPKPPQTDKMCSPITNKLTPSTNLVTPKQAVVHLASPRIQRLRVSERREPIPQESGNSEVRYAVREGQNTEFVRKNQKQDLRFEHLRSSYKVTKDASQIILKLNGKEVANSKKQTTNTTNTIAVGTSPAKNEILPEMQIEDSGRRVIYKDYSNFRGEAIIIRSKYQPGISQIETVRNGAQVHPLTVKNINKEDNSPSDNLRQQEIIKHVPMSPIKNDFRMMKNTDIDKQENVKSNKVQIDEVQKMRRIIEAKKYQVISTNEIETHNYQPHLNYNEFEQIQQNQDVNMKVEIQKPKITHKNTIRLVQKENLAPSNINREKNLTKKQIKMMPESMKSDQISTYHKHHTQQQKGNNEIIDEEDTLRYQPSRQKASSKQRTPFDGISIPESSVHHELSQDSSNLQKVSIQKMMDPGKPRGPRAPKFKNLSPSNNIKRETMQQRGMLPPPPKMMKGYKNDFYNKHQQKQQQREQIEMSSKQYQYELYQKQKLKLEMQKIQQQQYYQQQSQQQWQQQQQQQQQKNIVKSNNTEKQFRGPQPTAPPHSGEISQLYQIPGPRNTQNQQPPSYMMVTESPASLEEIQRLQSLSQDSYQGQKLVPLNDNINPLQKQQLSSMHQMSGNLDHFESTQPTAINQYAQNQNQNPGKEIFGKFRQHEHPQHHFQQQQQQMYQGNQTRGGEIGDGMRGRVPQLSVDFDENQFPSFARR